MTTAAEMLRRWEALNIVEMTGEAIEATKEEAIRLQQAQLYFKGAKADNYKLRPYKSQAYAKKKNAMNPNPGLGTPDFYLTGEFYRGMFVEVRGDRVIFDSVSPKAVYLIERDGPTIFGLRQSSKDVYAQTYMPLLQRAIKFKTGCI